MKIPVDLDRDSSVSLTVQLTDQLRSAIRQGRIPAGARLPSSRALAEQLDLGRNTVMRAYEVLTVEGTLQSRTAHGFFATRDPQGELRRPLIVKPSAEVPASPTRPMPQPLWARASSPRSAPRISTRNAANSQRASYDFVPGRANADLFPVKSWRRLLQGALAYRGGVGLTEQGDPMGLHALRQAIARHISLGRGIVADAAQIVITGGVQEGLSIVAGLFLSQESTVVMEDPGYESARLTFHAAGARVLGVRVDSEGLVTGNLPEQGATLAYVTPGHQFPTGHTLSPARRAQLVGWARRTGCYLLEDDYDSEFQYEGSPLQALAGMAPDCTIHLGTFSTTLGAGLRLGYMVVPIALVDAVRSAKLLLDRGNAWLDQAVLAEFVASGAYAAHVTRCAAHYRESRDALLTGLRRHFGSVVVSGQAVGLHLFWQLPSGVPEAARLEELACRHRVGVYSLASAGAWDFASSILMRRSLVLGFAGLLPAQIEQGIARLSDAVDDTLDDHHDFLRELLLDEPSPYRGQSSPLRKRGRKLAGQQPAVRTVDAPRQRERRNEEDNVPLRSVRGIYRYPIKGLSPQPVRGVALQAGKPFPFDRVFALTRPGVPMDPEAPHWAKKGLFLMLMLEDSLARVHTYIDVDTMELEVRPRLSSEDEQRAEVLLRADLTSSEGRAAVEAFFRRQVPELSEAPRLVRSLDGHFMDKPDNVISCINLATVRAVESELGSKVHPLRFRANFYIDGGEPWEEFDWIGSDIMLGDVLFRVDRRNGRCGATNVNPVTGERDLDLPGALRKRYGHKDLGIYLTAQTGGKVVTGDEVTLPGPRDHAYARTAAAPFESNGSLICRGCYYVYDEAKGAPGASPGTRFSDIRDDWRCPDCGTDKTNFRPYAQALSAAESG